MSGHSKWAKIHRQKSGQDAKKGAVFTKLGNLITLAAKEAGGDLDSNFKLRLAVDKAKIANMPKDNIERAIKRGTGEGLDTNILEETTYEIFGPGGSAFVVEAITDNRNRTISEIKAILNKNNGQLAGPNSVLWMFDKKGLINIKTTSNNLDDLELKIIDSEVDDIIKEGQEWDIYTSPEKLQQVINNIKNLDLEIIDSSLIYKAKEEIKIINSEDQLKIEKLFNALENLDDINNIYTNVNW